MMKRVFVSLLCGAMLLSMMACGSKAPQSSEAVPGGSSSEESASSQDASGVPGGETQIPNPFVDVKTAGEAAELAGFPFAEPSNLPEGFTLSVIQAAKGELAQAIYENGDDRLCWRKCLGSGDMSGDFNAYEQEETVQLAERSVKLTGNDDLVNLAVWNEGEYAFSISISGKGISRDAMISMVGE